MVSTKKFGIFSLTVPSPMRFKRAASAFNRCVGTEMRNKSYTTRDSVIKAFTAAAKACGR